MKLLAYSIWTHLSHSYSIENRATSHNFSVSNFKGILYHMAQSSDHICVKLRSKKYGNEHISNTYIIILVKKQCRATIIIKWTLLVKLS